MSPRATRRAAERQADKQLRKNNPAAPAAVTSNPAVLPAAQEPAIVLPAAFDFTDEEDDALTLHNPLAEKTLAAMAVGSSESPGATPEPTSDARLAANRENAKLSTGPRTSTGKAKSRLNAIKTGLCSHVVVLPHEDAAEYQQYLDRRFKKFLAVGDDEVILVQSLVDNEWRLARIASLEAGVYTLGTRVFKDEFADEDDPIVRAALIKVKTMQEYRRDLTNLALQERRLRNHIEKDTAKLEELQNRRVTKRKHQIEGCQKLRAREPETFEPSDIGFDFSTAELQAYLNQSANQFRLYATRPDFDLFLAAYRKEKEQVIAA
jgi:hypothetical protein